MDDVRGPDLRVAGEGPRGDVGEGIVALLEGPGVEVCGGGELDVDVGVVVVGLRAEGVPGVADFDDRWVWEVGVDLNGRVSGVLWLGNVEINLRQDR